MSQGCKDLTSSCNIHFKITGLIRRFSGRRNMSSSRIHYCYIILTKECRKKNICLFFLLENSRPLSPPWEPQIPFSSSGTPDFLPTCLGMDSLSSILQLPLWIVVSVTGSWTIRVTKPHGLDRGTVWSISCPQTKRVHKGKLSMYVVSIPIWLGWGLNLWERWRNTYCVSEGF